MGNAISRLTGIDTNIRSPQAQANIQKIQATPLSAPVPQQGGVDKVGNFFSNLAAQTAHMVTYAGTRIGQAGVQTYNEFQNPGYDTPVDYGNPQRTPGGGQTPLPVNAAAPGVKTSNSETKLQQPTQILGSTIAPQQQGTTGAEQIAGQGIEAAGTIGGLAAGGMLNPEAGLLTRAAQGAGVGAPAGGLSGAGEAMENGGSAGDVLKGTGRGIVGGAIAGGVLNAALPPIFGKIQDYASGVPSETPANLSARIQDATPSYDENMIGTNTMTPDMTDSQGNVVKGQITPRVASEGKGLNGERPVTTSASEHAAGTELNNVPNYPDNGTALEKSLATQKAISTEAEGMRGNLQAEDKANPLDTQAEKTKIENLVKSNLPKDIQEKLGYLSPEEEAKMTPTQKAYREALVSQQEETLPKTAAGRYYQKILDAVKEYNGTREGKLDLRQAMDSAYKNARGKLAFGSDSQNALDEIHSDIRESVNKDLKVSTQNTDTQASLDKQSNLYKAKSVLDDKAKAEASTHYGRFLQQHPTARNAVRILSRQGIMIPIRILESAAGLAAVYAAAKNLTK